MIPAVFDGDRWIDEPCDPSRGTETPAELVIATLNVWFAPFERVARQEAILRELESLGADLIALQEVEATLMARLLGRPWVREGYSLSTRDPRSLGSYGTLLLSRFPLHRLERVELPTVMGRDLLIAEISSYGQRARLGVVHLESTRGMAATRVAQLGRVMSALTDAPTAVLLGDHNFDPSWPEQAALDARYVDAWTRVHGDAPGWTEDTERNPMRRLVHDDERKVRFDRILVRSDDWAPIETRLFADRPIAPALPMVFPSDHFGVVTRLAPRGARSAAAEGAIEEGRK